jgi:amidase
MDRSAETNGKRAGHMLSRRALLGTSAGAALAWQLRPWQQHVAAARVQGGSGARGATLSSQAEAITATSILEATIPELQQALAAGTVSSRDLVTLYLARIAAYDQQGPALNAISWTNPNALAEATALDAERQAGATRGPLHGLPVVVKDNYDTTDAPTTAGSILLKGWVPGDDAFLVTQLRKAGAIILAKTNMHEWALGYETVGSLFGQTLNPYDLTRVPGGSSGGTGAAITANFAVIGLGTDTSGSIRVPSSENSLVGLRCTLGLLSRSGIVPLSLTQDVGGPLGRTVTDVALVMDALVGYDPKDTVTAAGVGNWPTSYVAALKGDALQGARIGMLTDYFTMDPADPTVTDLVVNAATEMQQQGATIVEVSIPGFADLLNSSGAILYDFKFDLDDYLAAHPTAPVQSLDAIVATGQYTPSLDAVMTTLDAVASRDVKEYYQILTQRTVLRLATLAVMADNALDALLYPTMRVKPVLIGAGSQTGHSTELSPQSGLPAVTVPAGFTADGLPVGAELLGRPWSEAQLLSFAYAYEQATHHRRPPSTTPALPSST